MTRFEWIDQTTELETTMPDPDDAAHRELRRQMWRRLWDIRDYLGGDGPEPRADWKPTVPDMTEAEKEAQRAKALEWFLGEMEGMKRDLAEMDAGDSGQLAVGSGQLAVGQDESDHEDRDQDT